MGPPYNAVSVTRKTLWSPSCGGQSVLFLLKELKKARGGRAVLLSTTDKGIREIAETVGIENYTYFIRLFKKMTGYSPGRYRKRPR